MTPPIPTSGIRARKKIPARLLGSSYSFCLYRHTVIWISWRMSPTKFSNLNFLGAGHCAGHCPEDKCQKYKFIISFWGVAILRSKEDVQEASE